MKKKPTKAAETSPEPYERAARRQKRESYLLRLYVSGISPRSTLAVTSIKKICEEYLPGRYELEVIDVYQQPALAAGEQIVAVPTLIKKLPAPLRRMIGDMSDTEKVLFGMDLKEKP